ncbi:Ldh family oxidoreductase [Burkholderia sp. WAC0059]|uniref:Ldh family oxidoreductase n=1 Tax=Burkholderia sp. WAC0059 TaxID=2066022 RepID=UPI0015E07B49|nr:Ldh family oxidoreductase [Burkholderia sp. WAC0059]
MKHYFFNDTVVVGADVLRNWVGDIFQAAGVARGDAALIADTLVVADARGVYSHGCLRVPLYLKRIEKHSVDPVAQPSIVTGKGALALVDGHNGSGQVVSRYAMDKAIELADSHGISFVTARNSNHNGALAYYSMMALQKDMIGLCTSIGGGNLMAPYGGAQRRIGNNPFSVALPALKRDAVVLDMAQSVVAKGKIVMAAKTHSKIPQEWALDSTGTPTTDPAAATLGFLRTMGDYKGSALSIVIGMISSMVAGAAIGPTLKDVYEDFEPLNIGHSFFAIRLDYLIDATRFKSDMDVQIDYIKQAKKAAGVDEIFVPGEIEARNYRRQMAQGIALPAEVVNELVKASENLGVDIPLPRDGTLPALADA